MKGYSFQELVKLAEAAVKRAGDTMTGDLTVPAVNLSGGQSSAPNTVTRKDYVDGEIAKQVAKTGDTMTGNLTAPTFTGALVGNAATATKLATARQINGTDFNGSDNITTANWGTARTLTIGNAAKSVNGAGNVSWSLSEIGAARSAVEVFSGTAANISTATFVQWLGSIGAFNDKSWTARCSWSYADNRTITDTGCGNIHLAGCTIEVISANESFYTIRVITPTTSAYAGTTGAEFIYVNNGPDYSPGWRRIYTTSNKPTAADVGLGNLINYGWNYSAAANTYAVRDGDADIHARLLRTTYGDGSTMSGAIAFRINNSTDNYTRYCSNPAAVRDWMKSAQTDWQMGWRAYIEHADNPMTEYHIPGRAAVITYLAADNTYRISSSNGAGGATAARLAIDPWGNLSTTGVIYEANQRVYSPNNQPHYSHNHSAAQGNADVISGAWNATGSTVFAQMYPADSLGAYAPGSRIPGSYLRPCSVDNDPDDMYDVTLPGTWQCQGYARGRWNNGEGDWTGHKTLWIRVA